MFDAVVCIKEAINAYKEHPEFYENIEEFKELNINALELNKGSGRTFSQDVQKAEKMLESFCNNPQSDEWEHLDSKYQNDDER